MVFDCQEISILISKSLDEKLSFRQRVVVYLHLMICGSCSRNKAQLQKLHELTRFFKKQVQEDITCFQLPDEAKKRLKEVLKKDKNALK